VCFAKLATLIPCRLRLLMRVRWNSLAAIISGVPFDLAGSCCAHYLSLVKATFRLEGLHNVASVLHNLTGSGPSWEWRTTLCTSLNYEVKGTIYLRSRLCGDILNPLDSYRSSSSTIK
jgi:hypothetical protein